MLMSPIGPMLKAQHGRTEMTVPATSDSFQLETRTSWETITATRLGHMDTLLLQIRLCKLGKELSKLTEIIHSCVITTQNKLGSIKNEDSGNEY